jgi:vancomycin resistance protein YoaR
VYWYSNHKIDLVFRNNTDQPIFIKAAVQSDPKARTKLVCNVYIYGRSLGDVSYDIVTEETPIEPPAEPKIVRDTKAEYVTYDDQRKVVQEAAKGASVVSYRVKYVGGVQSDEPEYLYTDIYKAKQQIVYVGTRTRK